MLFQKIQPNESKRFQVTGKDSLDSSHELIRAMNGAFFNHNQAPGQVCGPRRLGDRAGIEALGFAEKDCRKAAPKEEQDGKSCESNERLPTRRAIQFGEERTSQIGR